MKLILIRHAQTNLNSEKRYQGKGSDNKLNEYGIEQAKKTATFLKNEKIDIIFSSPQKRALQTAQIINEFHNLDIIKEEKLVERDFGDIEGKTYKEIDFFHIYKNNLYEKYKIEHETTFKERILDFFNYLHKNYFGKTILIVSHGGTLKMFLSELQNIPWDKGLFSIKKENASISIVELDKNKKIKSIEIGKKEHL